MKQLIQLIGMHYKEFWREPGVIFWSIFFPILMALGLGSAFTQKSELIRSVAVVSMAGNSQWNHFTMGYETEKGWSKKLGNPELGFTKYNFIGATSEEAIEMLKKGNTNIILYLQKDSIEYHFDPLNPEAQMAYHQLSSAINNKSSGVKQTNIVPMEQTGTRYIDFLIPGLLAMNIMMSCMWGISYNNIDKRIRKLLRRMVATPMKKSNYMLAQLISRITLGAMEAIILILFAWWLFDVQIQGTILALIIMFLAGYFAFTGIAIITSSRTDNTQIANGLINLVTLPMMILSGIFFSYHNFPDWMITIIEKLPLTMLADNIRSIFIEGAGIIQVLPKALILTAFGLLLSIPGLRIYKWY